MLFMGLVHISFIIRFFLCFESSFHFSFSSGKSGGLLNNAALAR